MNNEYKLDFNDFIFNNKDGINCGGFSVNSIMMKQNISPFVTYNHEHGEINKVSDLFNNLVVPSWVLSYHNKLSGTKIDEKMDKCDSDSDDDFIDDDLHDKLLELVKHDNKNDNKNDNNKKHKNTKKNIKNIKDKNKTAKNKNKK